MISRILCKFDTALNILINILFILDTEPDYKAPAFTQDPQLKDLISKLLRKNPDERLTDTEQLKAHPWFHGISWSEMAEKRSP